MTTHRRLGHPRGLGQLAGAMWPGAEQLHDSTPSGIGKNLEHIHQREIVNDAENYVKSHADVPAAGILSGMSTSPWSRYALVLVDLQRDFWTEAVARTVPELPVRAAALVTYARAEGLTVVHLRARFRPDGSDWIARYRLGNRIPCIDGTPGAATLSFAEELPGELVVNKQTFDGFLGTDLDQALAESGARGLLLAGLVTSTCVLFTAATATQRGYLVKVVSDCCSDRSEMHYATLAAYRFVFDTVRSDQIAERRDDWDAELDRMDTWRPMTTGSP
jgi:nicotinamidase-related amidase